MHAEALLPAVRFEAEEVQKYKRLQVFAEIARTHESCNGAMGAAASTQDDGTRRRRYRGGSCVHNGVLHHE